MRDQDSARREGRRQMWDVEETGFKQSRGLTNENSPESDGSCWDEAVDKWIKKGLKTHVYYCQLSFNTV